MYQNYDAQTLMNQTAAELALRMIRKELALLGAGHVGSLPPDPRTGGYEDADGNWNEYFKVGMALSGAPLRLEQE